MTDLPPGYFETEAYRILDRAIRAHKLPATFGRDAVFARAVGVGLGWLQRYIAQLPATAERASGAPAKEQPAEPPPPTFRSDEDLPEEWHRRRDEAGPPFPASEAAAAAARSDMLALFLKATATRLKRPETSKQESAELCAQANKTWAAFTHHSDFDKAVIIGLVSSINTAHDEIRKLVSAGKSDADAQLAAAAKAQTLLWRDYPEFAARLDLGELAPVVAAWRPPKGRRQSTAKESGAAKWEALRVICKAIGLQVPKAESIQKLWERSAPK